MCGESARTRGDALASLVAPDFTLPDLDGTPHSLSEHRGTKVFLVAMVGYLVFSLLNVVLQLTGVVPHAFGLLSGNIPGTSIPVGVVIGVLVVIMAAYSLVLDFDFVQQGVRRGIPAKYGWTGAFGIMVTVVWLYVEFLRLLAILRGNS